MALALGLALSCSGGKLPATDPYTGLHPGGGTPGTGTDGGGPIDSGVDSGTDAGPGTATCDGGYLQLGQVCDPLETNCGCAPGLTCEIDLATGTNYSCQSGSGDI